MKSKIGFSAIIFAFIGVLMFGQLNVINVLADEIVNPITSVITGVVTGGVDPSPSPIPTSEPITIPVTEPTPTTIPTPEPIITPVITTVFPNPATLGTIIQLTGSNLTDSIQIYLDNLLIPAEVYHPASEDGTSISFTLPAFTNFRANQTYKLYVKQDQAKSNEVDLSIAPSLIQGEATPSAGQVLIEPQTNLDSTRTEVLILNSNFNVNVSIPATVTNPTLNYASLLVGSASESHAAFNNILTITSDTPLGSVKVEIPSLTQIFGPANWDGIMNAPKVLANSSVTPEADSGTTATTQSVIEIGLGDSALTFDKAVRILIPGQAGKLVGFQRGTTFNKITSGCSSDSQSIGNSLAANDACYISVGSDLVIWTKHFTRFVTYTQTVKQSGQGSSNNSSSSQSSAGISSQAPVCGDSKPMSAPKLLNAFVSGRNQVTLVWSKALDPVSYYLIAYGSKSGSLEYGNPNVGGKDTSSYVVKGLTNNKTYYFKVRSGNGCMPGDYSNEVAIKASGGNIGNHPAQGFKSAVLSVKKSSLEDELKFQPITRAKPDRAFTQSGNLFTRMINFISNFFRRQ